MKIKTVMFDPPINIRSGETLLQAIARQPDTRIIEIIHDPVANQIDDGVDEMRRVLAEKAMEIRINKRTDRILDVVLVVIALLIIGLLQYLQRNPHILRSL